MRNRLIIFGVLLLVGLEGMGVLTVLFLYPKYRENAFRKSQRDKAVRMEVELGDPTKGKILTLENAQTLQEWGDLLSQATFFWINHPYTERQLYTRVFRESSRIDEYELVLDRRGAEYDHFSVVHRSGNSTRYGSAFSAPGLRKFIAQLPPP